MARLNWNDPNTRLFETGLDRGVLYPKTGPAVPWNGLTSVDEDGADESTTYYIEGRPFLNVPKPKEFTASIKAYTYPDEFNPMMGIVEATDGMYLDSQQSDVFDLSYRTLIGNGADGTKFGYKIHIIYNATVDPEGSSFASLTDSINPSEFSWNIKAVPVKIENYRSTAHIIIDTRHLEPNKLTEVENLLYGSDTTTVSSLPDPQSLFDALNFGDTVVIVDNGDGTWTASGPYKSIAVAINGEFRINDVDATFLGDGVYYFGEAPPVDPGPDMDEFDGGTPSSAGTGDLDGGTPAGAGGVVVDGGTP